MDVPLRGEPRSQRRQEAPLRPFTCEKCGTIDLGATARRRYLEHESRKPRGLDRAEARLRWAKAGIEVMFSNEEE